MNSKPTGNTRLKAKVRGWGPFKRIVLIHQTEIEYDHVTCVGVVDIERVTGWFDTKPEWLLENTDE